MHASRPALHQELGRPATGSSQSTSTSGRSSRSSSAIGEVAAGVARARSASRGRGPAGGRLRRVERRGDGRRVSAGDPVDERLTARFTTTGSRAMRQVPGALEHHTRPPVSSAHALEAVRGLAAVVGALDHEHRARDTDATAPRRRASVGVRRPAPCSATIIASPVVPAGPSRRRPRTAWSSAAPAASGRRRTRRSPRQSRRQ